MTIGDPPKRPRLARAPRHPVRIAVDATAGATEHKAWAVNLNRSGTMLEPPLETSEHPVVGQPLHLALCYPGKPRLELDARVAWTRDDARDVRGESVFAVGLAFEEADDATRARLDAVLRDLRPIVLIVEPNEEETTAFTRTLGGEVTVLSASAGTAFDDLANQEVAVLVSGAGFSGAQAKELLDRVVKQLPNVLTKSIVHAEGVSLEAFQEHTDDDRVYFLSARVLPAHELPLRRRLPSTHPQTAGPTAVWRCWPGPRQRAGGTPGGGAWATRWTPQAVEKAV